jgi:hypothetical protein
VVAFVLACMPEYDNPIDPWPNIGSALRNVKILRRCECNQAVHEFYGKCLRKWWKKGSLKEAIVCSILMSIQIIQESDTVTCQIAKQEILEGSGTQKSRPKRASFFVPWV